MRNETWEAILGSIAKWESIAYNDGKDLGGENCPLCKVFSDGYCNGCPIRKQTGQISCEGTPYQRWLDSRRNCASITEIKDFHGNAQAERATLAAIIELEFLWKVLERYYKDNYNKGLLK